MVEKICKLLSILNFSFAVGVLLPIAFVSFPSTFEQLSVLPFIDSFSPGKLGFLLIQLVLISTSAIGSLFLLYGWGGKLMEIVAILLAVLAIGVSILNPYWLGYLSVLQNIFLLIVESDESENN